ncbi:transposase [Rhodococcus sp. WB9]|uniref:transposase n=1 Tax=Rhodococcus sp. WB9 TaxID=2594007 RepID=UPI0021B2D7CE|nr:transposase [Rhodococcus sp. WB9]
MTVSRNARGQYHISILVEDTIAEPPSTGRVVGLDAGITSLYTLSTGGEDHQPAARAHGP